MLIFFNFDGPTYTFFYRFSTHFLEENADLGERKSDYVSIKYCWYTISLVYLYFRRPISAQVSPIPRQVILNSEESENYMSRKFKSNENRTLGQKMMGVPNCQNPFNTVIKKTLESTTNWVYLPTNKYKITNANLHTVCTYIKLT